MKIWILYFQNKLRFKNKANFCLVLSARTAGLFHSCLSNTLLQVSILQAKQHCSLASLSFLLLWHSIQILFKLRSNPSFYSLNMKKLGKIECPRKALLKLQQKLTQIFRFTMLISFLWCCSSSVGVLRVVAWLWLMLCHWRECRLQGRRCYSPLRVFSCWRLSC